MTIQALKIDFDKETGLGPADPQADPSRDDKQLMQDIQGNILKSHGRDHSRHLFIRFDPKKKNEARAWLATMADQVTSAMKQWDEAKRRRQIYAEAGFSAFGISAGAELGAKPQAKLGLFGTSVSIGFDGVSVSAKTGAGEQAADPEAYLSAQLEQHPSDVFINLMLSADGYRALGFPESELPADEAFRRGTRHQDTIDKLKDPAKSTWHKGFQEPLHALIIVADDKPERIQEKANEIRAALASAKAGQIVHEEIGKVLRLRPDGPPREHFGFADGVSEPHFLTKDIEKHKKQDGHTKWDPGAPLKLILAKDPHGNRDTGYGSYFVYRKLEQDIPHFNQQRLKLAQALAKADGRDKAHEGDKELAGAYMVGRFRNGMPVHLPANDKGIDAPIPNDFDYLDDKEGLKCPYQAHTRKTNPRGDTVWRFEGATLKKERTRRITRRAISYESDDSVGLLFICAQSNIANQFEFMQKDWCNDINFIAGGDDGKPSTGQDPVVGQGHADTAMNWPKKYGKEEKISVSLAESVKMRGAEYFFVPSRSFLKNARS